MREKTGDARRRACPWAEMTLAALVGVATAGMALGQAERTFFLTLDAVPFSAVAALEAEGAAPELFLELGSPVPLISTFPSTTTVALGAAFRPLGLESSPGYEARFFDWSERSIRGGGPISYFRIEFPWRDFFEWSKKGVARSAFASLRPVAASERRAVSAFEAFLDSDRSDFFAYIETTDTAAHLRGPHSLGGMFRRLGLAIRSARASGRSFRVVVFSDHGIAGGEPLENTLPRIVERLEAAGFERSRRLSAARDVVLTPYGLVSSFEAYTFDETTPELATVLVSTPGVALCSYREGGAIRVEGASGGAVIVRRGDLWAYRAETGDPLGYREISARLATGGPRDGDGGWHSDRVWFEATKASRYPDALRRVVKGFELVGNPASVICSLEEGYMYGPKRTELAARMTGGRLRWTHGALSWEASAGFLLTDVRETACAGGLRLGEALAPLLSTAPERFAMEAGRWSRRSPTSPPNGRSQPSARGRCEPTLPNPTSVDMMSGPDGPRAGARHDDPASTHFSFPG